MHAGSGMPSTRDERERTPPQVFGRALTEALFGDSQSPGVASAVVPPLPTFSLGTGLPPGLAHGSLLQGAPSAHEAQLEQLLRQQNELLQALLGSRMNLNIGQASAAAAAAEPETPSGRPQKFDTDKKLKLSKRVANKILEGGAKVKKQLHKISLSKDYIDKLTEQVGKLASGNIPPQLRPHKLPFQAEEWAECVDGEDLRALIVSAKDDETFEQLSQKLHIEALASSCVFQIAVQKRRVRRLSQEASLEMFTEEVMAAVKKEHDEMRSTVGTINFKESNWLETVDNEIREACKKYYVKQVRDVATEKLVSDEKKPSSWRRTERPKRRRQSFQRTRS